MSKVSKIFYKFQCFTYAMYVKDIEDVVCGFLCNTAYRVLLLISLMLKVFKMLNTIYSVYRVSHPCQEGRL